jgi:hypothetical protein
MTKAPVIARPQRLFTIFLLAFVTYWPALRVGFLWDDHVIIEANPALREWSWHALKKDFSSDVFNGAGDPYFRPAETELNRVNYAVWKLNPFGYHLTNLLGHALNAVLVGELAITLGLGNLVALLAGCLFAVHPMPVEQLMIAAGSAEIYGLTFLLLTVLLLARDEGWALAMGYFSFIVALFFKESGVMAPCLLALVYADQRAPKERYRRLLPLLLLIPPYLLLRRAAVGPLLPTFDPAYTLLFFVKAFPKVLLIYARLILVPWNLHSHRMMPHLSHAWPLLLLFLIVLPVILFRRGARLGLFGLAWFILCLIPKTPVMIYGNFMLDHFAYPAMIGMLLPLAAAFARLWESPRNPWRVWLGMTFFPLLIFWALLVHLNVQLRGTDEKMYRWALHFTTSHPVQYNLGVLLLNTGRPQEALPYLFNYLDAYPQDAHAQAAVARAMQQIKASRRPAR